MRKRDASVAVLYGLAALAALALAAPLLAYWQEWQRGAGLAVLGIANCIFLASFLMGSWFPKRRWAHPSAAARYVGQRHTALRSNLLSSVELSAEGGPTLGPGSEELRQALYRRTAHELAELRLKSVVPLSLVKRPLAITALIALAYLVVLFAAPGALAKGWTNLVTPAEPAPFDGATLVDEPLVGDLDIRIEFPKYSGKAALTLPASSGDFEALAGSRIEISTRALQAPSSARILFSETQLLSESLQQEREEAVAIDGQTLRASFTVARDSYYRFALSHGDRREVEARGRHVMIRADKTPSVELYAPGNELDVAKIKRLELAYVAEDDYGISKVELVYKAEGEKEYRHSLEIPNMNPSGAAPRKAQLKYLWDLAELPLRPGVQINYYVEVTDNDNVLGPNVGRSQSYSLRLFSPRERHEDLIARQKLLAEHMLALLATRLTGQDANLEAHRSVLRMAGDIIIEMGSLVAALKADDLASKALLTTLHELRDRMDARTRKEDALLSSLARKERSAAQSTAELASIAKRLRDSDATIIAELENDVLTLSDWLHRQDLENLLSIKDEINASRQRLDKLFEEYERTGSADVLAEIERELRALERKMQELAQKNAGIAEDVLDRFVNSDALPQDEDRQCLAKVAELFRAREFKEAKAQMAKCEERMDQISAELEESLQRLRGETFSEAEKLFNEKLEALSDLGADQQEIAKRTNELYESYAKAAKELQGEMSSEAKKHAGETLARLRKKLKEVPQGALSPFAKEEFEILEKRLKDAKTMLERGELAEALSAARYANRSLETVQDELAFSLDEAWTRQGYSAEKAARAAMPVARRLIEQLEEVTPNPSEILGKEDRAKLEKLRRMQKSVRQRSQQLQKELEAMGEKLPGKAGDAMREGLGKATPHMQQAEKQMRARDPSSAKQEAQEAAKSLKQAQENAQGAARQQQKRGQSSWLEEPIRIPGAEDYKAPEKFREEILDAMKNDSAPTGFADQVKRYYKDIIQ